MTEGVTKKRNWLVVTLVGLPILYFVSLFVVPLLLIVQRSFAQSIPGQVLGTGFSFDNYIRIFADGYFLSAIWLTLRISFLTALFTMLLGFPLAYFLSRTRTRWRGLLLTLTLAPVLVSIVVRAYGWVVLLSNRGLINQALQNLGLIDRPLRLVFNETGVLIGSTHVMLPFMVLTVMSSLQNINPAIEDAAASLGAKPMRIFFDIVVPLALPGLSAGFLLVFVLMSSNFATPILLGGQVVLTLPVLAYQQFTSAFNWPFGSAMVTVLLLAVVALTLIYDRLLRPLVMRGVAA